MLYIILLCAVILLLLFVWSERTTKKTHIPTIPAWKFIPTMVNKPQKIALSYEFAKNVCNFKGFFGAMMGPKRAYWATDPDAAQWLLGQKETVVKKSKLPETEVNRLVNGNVAFEGGDDWKRHRQVFNPGFNTPAYKSYFDGFTLMVDKCMTKLAEHENCDFNFVPMMSSFTIDLLGKSVFDYDFGKMDGKLNDYYSSYTSLFTPTRVVHFLLPFLDHLPIPSTQRLKNANGKLEELFDKMLAEAKHNSTKTNILSNMMNALENHEEGKPRLSRHELMSNMFILFVAGHETTSSALSWATYHLAANPSIQDKLYQEINKAIGNKPPSFDDLEIPYLNQFISENMRCYPPAPSLETRISTVDLHYEGQTIPKGSLLGVSMYNVHHHPDHWPDPFKFDPDRFSQENSKRRHKYSYVPFLLGPRMCLGNNFSLIEQRLFLIRLLQNFEVFPGKEHPLNPIYSKKGIGEPDAVWVTLKRRN